MKQLMILAVAMLYIGSLSWAACPSADLTEDNFVGLEDCAIIAKWWLDDCDIANDFCDGADFDLSGQVTLDDLLTVVQEWLEGEGVEENAYMILLPGLTFQMGDSFSEGRSSVLPVHPVTLSPFYMGRYELTNQQYCDFLNSAYSQNLITITSNVVYMAGSGKSYPYCDTYQSSTDSQINWDGSTFSVLTKSGRSMANDPMVMVSWYGAVAYCNWLSQQEGKPQCYNLSTWAYDPAVKGYHLPTEAQWEYAARGGLSGKRFPWGDTINQTQANFVSRSLDFYDVSPVKNQNHPLWNDGVKPYTSPVGFFDHGFKYKSIYNWPGSATSYQTDNGGNGYGLYDMAGNVWELCQDWYDSYSAGPQTNPTGPTTGTFRVLRGGSWSNNALQCRVANRSYNTPAIRTHLIGFRLSLDF